LDNELANFLLLFDAEERKFESAFWRLMTGEESVTGITHAY